MLLSTISELAAEIRRMQIPKASGLIPETPFELKEWAAGLKSSIELRTYNSRYLAVISYISESVRNFCNCNVMPALYDGAGSFNILTSRRSVVLGEIHNFTIFAQKALLGRPLDNNPHAFLPLYSKTKRGELFHGFLISDNKHPCLEFFAHHLGCELGDGDPSLYCPAVDGGKFQNRVEKLISGPIKEITPANPSAGLAPPVLEKPKMQKAKISKEVVANELKGIFGAEEYFFAKYEDGKMIELHENVAAVSAMIGAPYQSNIGGKAVISIPQYGTDRFIGAHVICRKVDEPPLLLSRWLDVLRICRQAVGAWGGDYAAEAPWRGYIDVWDPLWLENTRPFPPSVPASTEGILKFGQPELGKISDWLAKCIKQRRLYSTMIARAAELADLVGRKGAMEFYQASTTTIMDICSRAEKEPWDKTVRSVFSEAAKFFEGEEIFVMWLAVNKGGGRFDVYHSGGGELVPEDKLACEIFAQWTTLIDNNFFAAADNNEPVFELVRSRVGEAALISIPIYIEEEATEREDGWTKHTGPLAGTFALAVSPKRGDPAATDWAKWRMFVPRICHIMKIAKSAGKLNYSIQ